MQTSDFYHIYINDNSNQIKVSMTNLLHNELSGLASSKLSLIKLLLVKKENYIFMEIVQT